MSKTKGWTFEFEEPQVDINPIIYVYDAIKRNKDNVDAENITELIKLCFSYAPHRKLFILDKIAEAFPDHLEKINSYRILSE